MSPSQIVFAIILLLTICVFLWGKWRFDLVAFVALMITAILGLIERSDVFSGFSHPATITVVEVFILSRVLKNAGLGEMISRSLEKLTHSITGHLASISFVGALLSAFINNVGAIALLMPTAISSAIAMKRSPSLLLMPLSFATILGGMITLIGTPPNIIISAYRQRNFAEPFGIFDFAYVGIPITIVGLIFISLLGWRLLPKRVTKKTTGKEAFAFTKYIAQVKLTSDSSITGEQFKEVRKLIEKAGLRLVGAVREDVAYVPSRFNKILKEEDALLIEGNHEGIRKLVSDWALSFYGANISDTKAMKNQNKKLLEVFIGEESSLINKKLSSVPFQKKYGASLIAVSRHSYPIKGPFSEIKFNLGDILLMYGDADKIDDIPFKFELIPLAERDLLPPVKKNLWIPISIFALAIAITALDILPLQVSFGLAIILMLLVGAMTIFEVYEGINWPVIVLIGSFIPLGQAFESTGLADFIVSSLLGQAQAMPLIAVIAILMAVTMTISDIINNTATAVIMAPIAVGLAEKLEVSSDGFLMTVAIASSCAFLTPIGHKNNIIVMGPGGYKFGDYWRMGLPLEIIIVLIGTPLVYYFWI